MRIVLDTNVLMSGIFFGGTPYRILQEWEKERVQLVVCLEILAEYREVAARLSRRYRGVDILPLIDLVTVHSQIVRADPLPQHVCEDPKDDVFFACATAGKARIIISGDKHLLRASGFAGIQVIRPKAFVETFL